MALGDLIFEQSLLGSPVPASVASANLHQTLCRPTMPADLCLREVVPRLEDHAVGPVAKQIGSSFQGHPSAPISWWSILLDCDLWPGSQTPFCTLTMSVHSHNRCIHHDVFHVRLVADSVKQLLKNISFDPVTEPLEDGVPFAKLRRQISPRATCSCNPKHCFQEESIVGAAASSVSNLPQTQWAHTSPLLVCQNVSHHRAIVMPLQKAKIKSQQTLENSKFQMTNSSSKIANPSFHQTCAIKPRSAGEVRR